MDGIDTFLSTQAEADIRQLTNMFRDFLDAWWWSVEDISYIPAIYRTLIPQNNRLINMFGDFLEIWWYSVEDISYIPVISRTLNQTNLHLQILNGNMSQTILLQQSLLEQVNTQIYTMHVLTGLIIGLLVFILVGTAWKK